MKPRYHLLKQTGETVAARLEVADRFWARFLGLQFRRELPVGAGLLLVPCSSIHTFWVRFAIDVVLLDRAGTVLAVRQQVKPWRLVMPVRHSYATLELPAGSANVAVGDSLFLAADSSASTPPASLAFLARK